MRAARSLVPIGLLAATAGCMMPRAPVAEVTAGPDRAAVARVTQQAAARVRTCYRGPRVPRAARQIATTLAVRFNPDGTLIGLPQVARQTGVTPEGAPFAARMAEAAALAVINCTPLALPAELYQGGWDGFELTFSPAGAA